MSFSRGERAGVRRGFLHAKISHLLYPKVGIGRESVPYEAAGEAPLDAKISWYGLAGERDGYHLHRANPLDKEVADGRDR
jgi:hypothetical protein